MKIAFDIQTAIGGKNTGVGVYTDLMRKGFSARKDVNVIELKRKSDKPITGALSRAWWEQIQMPSYASLTSADILFSPGFSAQKVKNMPLAIAVHDLIPLTHPYELGRFNRWYWQKIVPQSWQIADLRICVSYETQKTLHKVFPSLGKTVVVQHGLSDAFKKRETNTKDYFLMVGAWPKRKNFLSVIHAIFSVKNSPKLKVVGLVPAKLQTLAKGLLGDKVEFEGYKTTEEIICFYRSAIAVLCPSLAEGFGFVPMEAAACGAPVLMSDIPSHREALPVVKPYGDPQDKESLPRAIRAVLKNRSSFKAPDEWEPKTVEKAIGETLKELKAL